jgi:epoxyqueuosine reductase QueG
MNEDILIDLIFKHVRTDEKNYVDKNIALTADLADMQIFEEPLVGFAAAGDAYFKKFKAGSIIGEHFMLPEEWNQEAKTVISFFLPFTERVKAANKKIPDWPANEWLHARIEGQSYIAEICGYLKNILEAEGYVTAVPFLDKRFSTKSPVTADRSEQGYYTSNWSERHAAFVCGLGTFGLSKGLITAKGIAGRFGSLITGAYFEPSKRAYSSVYEYCSRCGACAKNCPVQAISLEQGKKHAPCSDFLGRTMKKHNPRYGCGKCQVKVPCENKIPSTGRA